MCTYIYNIYINAFSSCVISIYLHTWQLRTCLVGLPASIQVIRIKDIWVPWNIQLLYIYTHISGIYIYTYTHLYILILITFPAVLLLLIPDGGRCAEQLHNVGSSFS